MSALSRTRPGVTNSLRPRVLLTTEGTYPYSVGGVSLWCDFIVRGLPEIEWRILPVVAGGQPRAPVFDLPAHAVLAGKIDLWSEQAPDWRWGPRRDASAHTGLPGILVRELMSWRGDVGTLIESLVWCRQRPSRVRRVFRSMQGWESFLDGLQEVLDERADGAGVAPPLDVTDAARLYQTLYWVARTAAVSTPRSDVLHVTAAGWAVIPALVDQALHGTPLLVTEHGVYVREAYLAAARSESSPQARFVSTRLARSLAHAAYDAADVIAPVVDANARWEEGLDVDPAKIRVIYNGVRASGEPTPPPGTRTIVSVGRIDPLKDVHTMLRVMAEVIRLVPDACFLHYGPVTEGQDAYGDSCLILHEQLGLADRFRFMGTTADPDRAVREADVVLMTSISEALPLSILEAMAQARPVVATGVGGVSDVVRGCGFIAPPGDVHRLAVGVTTLLRNPALAAQLGERGGARVERLFNQHDCLGAYQDLLTELAA